MLSNATFAQFTFAGNPAAAVTTVPQGATNFFDRALKPSLRGLGLALITAAVVSPVLNPTPAPAAATTFFDRVAPPIGLKAALGQGAASGQLNGTIVSTTPQGWWSVLWERLAKPFPVSLQIDNRDTWLGNVPTQFVGNAWVVAWDGPARKRFPAAAQQVTQWGPQGDLVSTPQGWPFAWPERFAKPYSPVLQQVESWPRQGTIVSITPQGWPATYPDRFAKPFPISLQLLNGDQWVGNVPTAFVGNAWVVHWDRPQRAAFPARAQQYAPWQPMGNVPTAATPQGWPAVFPERFAFKFHQKLQRAAQPTLGAYGTVVVTFPDGWQTSAPDARRPLQKAIGGDANGTQQQAAVTGWQAETPVALRRMAVERTGQSYPFTIAATFNAWIAVPDQIHRKRQGQSAESAPQAVTAPVTKSFDVWPQPRFRAALLAKREPVRPPDKPPPFAAPGNTDLWSQIDWRFRIIRPPPPDFHRDYRVFPRIASQPSLSGVSAGPTLSGVSTSPTLVAESTNPRLVGISTNPTLLGVSTNPALKGEV